MAMGLWQCWAFEPQSKPGQVIRTSDASLGFAVGTVGSRFRL